MADNKIFYEYLTEYLNDELDPQLKASYESKLDDSLRAKASHYAEIIGKLQMSVQKLRLNEADTLKLHDLVADSKERETSEMASMSHVEKLESVYKVKTKLYWFIAIAIVLAIAIYHYLPKRAPVFNPIETVNYEAQALENDSQGRILFPSSKIDEVKSYFDTDKSIDYKPVLLESIPSEWHLVGASILDYEIEKVLLIQYNNSTLDEKLSHFIVRGEYNLENNDSILVGNITFYSYASDQLNMIVWETPTESTSNSKIINIVTSRRGIQNMLSIVGTGLGLDVSGIKVPESEQNTAPATVPTKEKVEPVDGEMNSDNELEEVEED